MAVSSTEVMRSQARMEGWYQDGTQVVFACGGGIYTSAVEAAEQYDGKVIGVDVDQRPKIGDLCITSAMKGLGSAVNSALDAYFGGNWASIGGKSEQLGLAQGDYLGLPTDTDSWGFTTFTVDEYNTVLDGLKDGSITVSNDTENQPEVGSHVTVDYVTKADSLKGRENSFSSSFFYIRRCYTIRYAGMTHAAHEKKKNEEDTCIWKTNMLLRC